MPTLPTNIKRLGLLLTVLCIGLSARAQFPGFGGFGGNSGRSSSSRSGSNNRTSSNAGVGDAIISVDSETQSLVVIADKETSKYIRRSFRISIDRGRRCSSRLSSWKLLTVMDLTLVSRAHVRKNLAGSAITGFTTNFGIGPSNTIVPTAINPITRGSSTFTGANTFGMPSVGSASGLYNPR